MENSNSTMTTLQRGIMTIIWIENFVSGRCFPLYFFFKLLGFLPVLIESNIILNKDEVTCLNTSVLERAPQFVTEVVLFMLLKNFLTLPTLLEGVTKRDVDQCIFWHGERKCGILISVLALPLVELFFRSSVCLSSEFALCWYTTITVQVAACVLVHTFIYEVASESLGLGYKGPLVVQRFCLIPCRRLQNVCMKLVYMWLRIRNPRNLERLTLEVEIWFWWLDLQRNWVKVLSSKPRIEVRVMLEMFWADLQIISIDVLTLMMRLFALFVRPQVLLWLGRTLARILIA